MDTKADVVVVGAGPAGSAAAAWAARAGRDVLVVDSAQFPRDKACGDGLTPRAVAELERLGLGPWLDSRIRHRGLRMSGFGGEVEIDWPGPSFPSTGSAVPRTELDDRIREVAADEGAKMLLGVKAVGVQHDSSGRVCVAATGLGCVDRLHGSDRRRRSTVDAGPGARPRMAQGDGVRRGDPRVHRDAAQQRAVDHVAPGTAVTGRRVAAGIRLDLPAGQWRGEHRRRGTGDGEAARRCGVAAVDVLLHDAAPRGVGLRRRAAARDVRAAADGRRGVRGGRAELDADRRRRGLREPAERRGHRLRTGDRAAGRRTAWRRRSVGCVACDAARATTPGRSRWRAGWHCC